MHIDPQDSDEDIADEVPDELQEDIEDEEEATEHPEQEEQLVPEEENEVEEPLQRRRGPEVHSLQEVIAALPGWARQNTELLRAHLTGIIALVTTDPHRAFRIDWTGERLVVESGDTPSPDCRISLSQSDLMRVVKGDLNPQIGMLSGRIKASGNPEMAMYLFNLLVRR